MITLNQEHRLGPKAFILLLIRRVAVGFTFFVLASVLSMARGVIMAGLLSTMQTAGSATALSPDAISVYIENGISALFLFSIILMLIGFFISWIQYRFYAFRFDEFDLHMRQGILSRKEVAIPYRQMQDINIFRSLIYQMLGVSRLIIDSAGHEEKDAKNQTDIILEPLDMREAEDIRDFLERRIGVQIVKDIKEEDNEDAPIYQTTNNSPQ